MDEQSSLTALGERAFVDLTYSPPKPSSSIDVDHALSESVDEDLITLEREMIELQTVSTAAYVHCIYSLLTLLIHSFSTQG